MNIFIDLDDTLVYFKGTLRDQGVTDTGSSFYMKPREDWTPYETEIDNKVRAVMLRPGFFRSLRPLPGAQSFITRVRKEIEAANTHPREGTGARLCVLTAYPEYLTQDGIRRVCSDKVENAKLLFDIPPNRVFCMRRQDKHLQAFSIHGLPSFLVDDNERTVREWLAAGGQAYLFKGDYEQALQEVKKHLLRWTGEPTWVSSVPKPAVKDKTTVPLLPTDSAARKNIPLASGLFDYFPAALAAVAAVSKAGNDKHNPGQPMHWSRGKSDDHADTLLRHFAERGTVDEVPDVNGNRHRHSAMMAWRALAILQLELEAAGSPIAETPRK